MAQGSNEHRMVFDIRGRRGYVIKVVYAILALLMVASLFLVTGAVNINSLFGNGSSGESAVTGLEQQAENVEANLAKEPGNPAVLGNLTRARVNVANTMINSAEENESQSELEEGRQQLAKASEDWSKYVEAGEPSPGVAAVVAPALFRLAEYSSTSEEALENVKAATEAQLIVAEAQPSAGTWSQAALYGLFTQEYKKAEHAKEETAKLAETKFERESFENEYEEAEKNAKKFGAALKSEKTTANKSAGKESLENPLGATGLGGG